MSTKFIIIGLGNFGAALGAKLTELGHEVIGVDNDLSKVELNKDRITHTICLDATDPVAAATLPIKECDVLLVAIGEDFGASVLTTAIFKRMGVKRLIGRGISSLHKTVLEALEIDEIVMPEEEAAGRLAKALDMKGVIDALELSEKYSIIEVTTPQRYVGQTIAAINLRSKYNLNIVTIKRFKEEKGIFGVRRKGVILGVIPPKTTLLADDILVLFGTSKDFERFMGKEN